MARKFKILDLFCGCGGISRGFERTGRFNSELGVEIMPHPCTAYVANIKKSDGAPCPVINCDIRELTKSEGKFSEELSKRGVSISDIDVIVGGPPCQGFSRNGVRKYKSKNDGIRFYDDPRNHLYRSFLWAVEQVRPKAILIENVREFLNYNGGKFSSDLISRLCELNYDVEYKKVCAADFGVPQKRHRVIFIAWRKDLADKIGHGIKFPIPDFQERKGQLSIFGDKFYRTVRDAIGDLPSPNYDEKAGRVKYDMRKKTTEYARELMSKNGVTYNHFARPLSEINVARVRAVGTGRMRDIDERLQTEEFYGSAYGRLDWDQPSLTITTWVYHVGSGRFAHPVEDRGITMREAARLQSFDDDFVFPPLINPVSQMIGNAVPPLLAQSFAREFAKWLDRTR